MSKKNEVALPNETQFSLVFLLESFFLHSMRYNIWTTKHLVIIFIKLGETIVKPKQAGTCWRSIKHHPRCQISIYVQFSLWCKVLFHIFLKVNQLNLFYSILYKYILVIWHMFIFYAPPTSASLFWFYYSCDPKETYYERCTNGSKKTLYPKEGLFSKTIS